MEESTHSYGRFSHLHGFLCQFRKKYDFVKFYQRKRKKCLFTDYYIFFSQLVLQLSEQYVIKIYSELGGSHQKLTGILTEKVYWSSSLKNTE